MSAPFADFGTGYQAPRLTVRRVAGRLDSGEMLLRRWAGCWIDFIVLGALWLGPFFVLPMSQDWAVWVGILATLAYFPVTEGLWGRSLGKLVTGTVVVTTEGRMPGILRAIVRTVLRLFEVNPFLLGGLPAGIAVMANGERRRLGDLAAGTFVIPYSELKHVRTDDVPLEAFD